jgi:pimeloyl-ACP methyl ester carboxylesterase
MHLELLTQEPEATLRATPLLFVHGAWHGAWCWAEHFLPYFAQHGYVSHALDLRGHGKSDGMNRLRWTSIANYVADVEQVIRHLERPPVLIGHSMGGLIVQKYLETYRVPAAVLLASVPISGTRRYLFHLATLHPLIFLKINTTLRLSPLVETPSLTHEAFFSADMPAEKVHTYWTRMQNESYRASLDMMLLSLPRPQRVQTPLLVLGGERDTIFRRTEVEATARAYHAEAKLFPMAHDMMLEDRWQEVADYMLAWLDERTL